MQKPASWDRWPLISTRVFDPLHRTYYMLMLPWVCIQKLRPVVDVFTSHISV